MDDSLFIAGPGKLKTTITYLAMTAPPAGHPVHPPQRLKLALMRAEQPTVSYYRYLYNTVGEPWLWVDRRQMGDDEVAAIIQDADVSLYVLYAAGVPAGFAELDFRMDGVANLSYFGLVPDFIGRGLGLHLLDWSIRRAWSHPIERLTVNTCTFDHPKALPLYQRLGFAPVERRERVIDDPRVTGLLPPEAAPHVPIT